MLRAQNLFPEGNPCLPGRRPEAVPIIGTDTCARRQFSPLPSSLRANQRMTSNDTEAIASADGVPGAKRPPRMTSLRGWRNSERLMPVLATLPLYAGIFALALAVDQPEDAVS